MESLPLPNLPKQSDNAQDCETASNAGWLFICLLWPAWNREGLSRQWRFFSCRESQMSRSHSDFVQTPPIHDPFTTLVPCQMLRGSLTLTVHGVLCVVGCQIRVPSVTKMSVTWVQQRIEAQLCGTWV